MKKKIILLTILLSIFMINAVSATSNNSVASNSKLTKSISPTIDAGDVDTSNVKNSEVKEDTNNVLKKDNSKKIVSKNNNHTKNEVTSSSETESYKDYYDDYDEDYAYETVHNAYIKSKKVYYKTNNKINFGWKGNFEGYFKVYKGNKQIESYYAEGYNQEYTYNPNGLSVGKYTTKLISDNGQTVAKGKIVVKIKDAYIKSKKVYYSTDNKINFGWKGNFEGYFKVYKGNKQVYSYYTEGYNIKDNYNPNGLKIGKYTTKLISGDKTVAKGKIIVKKVPSKITVYSFKTYSGTKFTCYAYVYNKKDNNYLNEGYVKFKIKGKTYKAKVKNGAAKIKFKVPRKTGKYICKAKYYGTKNTKNSKTIKFKMIVKGSKIVKIGKYKCKLTPKDIIKIKNGKQVNKKAKHGVIISVSYCANDGSTINGKYYVESWTGNGPIDYKWITL